MKSTTLLSTVALLVLAGGGLAEASVPEAPTQTQAIKQQNARACHEQKCEVIVKVTGCAVTVDPYFLVMVPKRDEGRPSGYLPIKVTWTITGGTFAEKDPIRWKDYGASRVFHTPQLVKDRKSIALTNSGARGIYHYGIRVLDDKGQPCPELDPTGINDPP